MTETSPILDTLIKPFSWYSEDIDLNQDGDVQEGIQEELYEEQKSRLVYIYNY